MMSQWNQNDESMMPKNDEAIKKFDDSFKIPINYGSTPKKKDSIQRQHDIDELLSNNQRNYNNFSIYNYSGKGNLGKNTQLKYKI